MPRTLPTGANRSPGRPAGRTSSRRAIVTNWQQQLPVLASGGVVLRQLKQSDAAPLFMLLTTEEVARFITPPPTTVAGFEQFIAWAIERQREGRVAFFAVTVRGSDAAVGLFQVRALEDGFTAAEWGFAIGSPYWGTGLFPQGASLTLDFAFETLGVHRLEARSMVANARGNAALRKVGATDRRRAAAVLREGRTPARSVPLVDSGRGLARLARGAGAGAWHRPRHRARQRRERRGAGCGAVGRRADPDPRARALIGLGYQLRCGKAH